MSTSRRSARQAVKRKQSVYVDPDTDDDLHGSSDEEYENSQTAKRVRTSTTTRSRPGRASNEKLSERSTSPVNASKAQRHPKRPRRLIRHQTLGSSIIQKVGSLAGRPRRKAQKHHSKKEIERLVPPIPSDGIVPSWQTLPYELLLQIFTYAYTPDSHAWLIKTAHRLCRAFAEPALTAFYRSPTLPSSYHLEHFHALLSKPRDLQWMDYRQKVRRLELDIGAFTDRREGANPFELASLVAELPQLKDIIITSLQDKPPYRLHGLPRWRYPSNLYESLDINGRQLKSWRWNWMCIKAARNGQAEALSQYFTTAHLRPSFQSLQHLEISNYPAAGRLAGAQAKEAEVAEIINLLPALKSLELESCDIVHAPFIEKLPQSLTRLRIANSPGLTSDAIHAYLSKNGSCQLVELVLDHNVRLDLAFLPTLKDTCPHLQSLRMDLHYYSQHHTVNDSEAKYDYLLGADEHPSWPSTLTELVLVHLQKWNSEGAQNLFQSLINSAAELSDLRKLILHAHINISWRDRISFREKWIERLQRVFLDKTVPNPHLASMKAYRIWNGVNEEQQHPMLVPRKIVCVEIPHARPSLGNTSHTTSDSEPLRARRSKRIASNGTASIAGSLRHSGTESDAVSVSSGDGDSAAGDNWRRIPEKFVHGLCNTVDITIDNQRPREEQLNESHFLDSEGSGDEEWNPGDEMPDEDHAW